MARARVGLGPAHRPRLQPPGPQPHRARPIPLQPGADGVATGGGFAGVANRDLNTVTRVNARSRRVDGDPYPGRRGAGQPRRGPRYHVGYLHQPRQRHEDGPRHRRAARARIRSAPAPEGIVVAHGARCGSRTGATARSAASTTRATSSATAEVGEAPVQLAATADAVRVTVSKENKIVELHQGSGDPTGRSVPDRRHAPRHRLRADTWRAVGVSERGGPRRDRGPAQLRRNPSSHEGARRPT